MVPWGTLHGENPQDPHRCKGIVTLDAEVASLRAELAAVSAHQPTHVPDCRCGHRAWAHGDQSGFPTPDWFRHHRVLLPGWRTADGQVAAVTVTELNEQEVAEYLPMPEADDA